MTFCGKSDCDYCNALLEALNEYLLDQMPLAQAAEYTANQIENYLKEQNDR